MKGRGSNAVSDDIEFLDAAPSPATQVDHVESGSSNRSGAAAAVVAAIAAAVFVVGFDNSPPPPEAPDVTIERTENTDPQLTEREQLEDQFGVDIGDGPDLVWQPVDVDVDTRSWLWTGDNFVSDNGTTARSVGYGDAGLAVSERPSLLIDYPDYQFSAFDGGQLLVPIDSALDHVIVIRDRTPVRIELPEPPGVPTSALFETYLWAQGEIVGDRLVVRLSASGSINLDELEARTDIDLTGIVYAQARRGEIHLFSRESGPAPDRISFEDAGLSPLELSEVELLGNDVNQLFTIDLRASTVEPLDFPDFQYIDQLVLSPGGELLLGWADTNELEWDSSTNDGITWSTERSTKNRWVVSSGTQLVDLASQFTISRSGDGGRLWVDTVDPLRNSARAVAGDVIALGRPQNNYGTDAGVIVDTENDFWLTMFDHGERFELRGIRTFETPLATGWIEDPMSGASRDWLASEFVFTDPRTGDELLRVSEFAVESAFAIESPMETIAFARWPVGIADPEWLITSPVEVFGAGALAVDFVGGDQQLMAIVTTIDGFEFYIADTSEAS